MMPDATEIANGKNFFPKMPSEVFDLWIMPGIKCYGWQFTSASQSVEATGWKGFFGSQPLSFWANARWKRVSMPASKHTFHPETQARIIAIIGTAQGFQTVMANLRNSKKRFWACAAFIQKHGTIPFPVVATPTKEGFDLVDGHHRLAAFVHLGLAESVPVPVWLALDP
jgi:ParB/Sulfiredoxin domain